VRSKISNPTRRRLAELLASERLDGTRLIERLRQLRRVEGVETCSAMFHLMTHLSLPEAEAEQLLMDLDGHRREVSRTLGRDPGLRVAAVDYLYNVKGLLLNPAIVELEDLEVTEHSAVTDSLTGLHNRRYFDSALDIEARRSRRYRLGLSLLLLDLDHFKQVNDLHGHRFGDQVLGTVGAVLRRAVRDSDVACRFGGEEFAVILPETNRIGAFSLAERVRERVRCAFEQPIEGISVELSVSGGVATFPMDGEDAEELIDRADRALYLAKESGRDRIVLHHAERRRFVRFPVREGGAMLLRSTDTRIGARARALNLSRHSALLSVDGEMPGDGPLEVTFRVAGREWVLPAVIVYQDERGLAVRFTEPLPDECLEDHVRRSAPAREKRP
jgi:diguanylate cyclase (GGDEF)-like protein